VRRYAVIHQIFRDADMKESHIYASSSPGECYFPLLYYTCTSAYHECREVGEGGCGGGLNRVTTVFGPQLNFDVAYMMICKVNERVKDCVT
jgi:hypothetical protein